MSDGMYYTPCSIVEPAAGSGSFLADVAGNPPYGVAQHPLATMLDAAVPLYIEELHERGGPNDADIDTARSFVPSLTMRGDVLLYGGKPAEAGDLANRLAFAIAVMSFMPGGITAFGQKWES